MLSQVVPDKSNLFDDQTTTAISSVGPASASSSIVGPGSVRALLAAGSWTWQIGPKYIQESEVIIDFSWGVSRIAPFFWVIVLCIAFVNGYLI